MNPLTYISNITGNKTQLSKPKTAFSPEVIALLIFIGFYVGARCVEVYLLPLVPEFLTREVSALFRWGPILVPIIFGITFFSKKTTGSKNPVPENYDKMLKERMMSWTK